MFGTNPVAKVRQSDFNVHSMFYTIQGEGPMAGQPALFLRLAGCNLRCFWCDTEFEQGAAVWSAVELAEELCGMLRKHRCSLVVITGGEPMLQPLGKLIEAMADCAYASFATNRLRFQIETAGTVWPFGFEETLALWAPEAITLVCSPKTIRVHPKIAEHCRYYKYIVNAAEPSTSGDGLPNRSTQQKGKPQRLYRPDRKDAVIYVQACDETAIPNTLLSSGQYRTQNSQHYAAEVAMEHGYRLSVQMHKVAGID